MDLPRFEYSIRWKIMHNQTNFNRIKIYVLFWKSLENLLPTISQFELHSCNSAYTYKQMSNSCPDAGTYSHKYKDFMTVFLVIFLSALPVIV